MVAEPHPTVSPLDAAIDRHPLVVAPTTPLADAIVLMSQTRGFTCSLGDQSEGLPSTDFWHLESRSSCVLVVEAEQVLGILTERDVVRLTAQQTDLTTLIMADVMVTPVVTLAERNFREIFAALFLFRRYRIRHLVIVDDHQSLVGVVSHESIRQVLRPTNLLKLRRVVEVMTSQAFYAPPTTTVTDLTRQMAERSVSSIVIADTVDAGPSASSAILPLGIVTERDIVQFQALGLNLNQTLAQTVMSCPLFLASPEDSLWDAHQTMQRHRVQRLVVSWNWGQGLGIITQSSLLRVFDPVEMYGVEDTLNQESDQRLPEPLIPNFSPLSPANSASPRLQPWTENSPASELEKRLLQLSQQLEGLPVTPAGQDSLRAAIAEVKILHDLVLGTRASWGDRAFF
ncbi:MAG: CBS domain-containing protein [Nodosilinea sp.]